MTKLALISDIHGNINALNIVLEKIKAEKISKLLICGDFTGYYYHTKEVLDALNGWEYEAIQGNHDYLLGNYEKLDLIQKVEYKEKYGSSLEKASNELSQEQIKFFKKLPKTKKIEIDGKSILLCHGVPWDRDKYVYPDTPAELLEKFKGYKEDIIIMGHTHYPMEMKVGGKLLLNPGSVGQTRNWKPGAYWAVLDAKSGKTEFRSEKYDTELVAAEVHRIDPGVSYLADVLTREK